MSEGVQRALAAYGNVSTRFAGATRYETNNLINDYGARAKGWSTSQVFLASGANFPDALTIAPYLVWKKCPIVLVDPSASSLTAEQSRVCQGADQAVALGGTGVVSDALLSAAASITRGGAAAAIRLGGAHRYATSALIVEWELKQGMTLIGAGFATGRTFPDALASSYLLGCKGSVLGLVTSDGSNEDLLSVIRSAIASALAPVPSMMRVFGGTSAVSEAVRNQVTQAVGWSNYDTKKQ